jgi:hypothetical protein
MAQNTWKTRPAPKPTGITEIARRYHAAAWALAQTLGLSIQDVLTQHRESVTAIFIECGKCELRLPSGVALPPLMPANGLGELQPEPSQEFLENSSENLGGRPKQVESEAAVAEALGVDHRTVAKDLGGESSPVEPELDDVEGEEGEDVDIDEAKDKPEPLPTMVPGGCPCSGIAISQLKPAQLAMLLAKTANCVHEEGDQWLPLLAALNRERAARLERGRRPGLTPMAGDGHDG